VYYKGNLTTSLYLAESKLLLLSSILPRYEEGGCMTIDNYTYPVCPYCHGKEVYLIPGGQGKEALYACDECGRECNSSWLSEPFLKWNFQRGRNRQIQAQPFLENDPHSKEFGEKIKNRFG